MGVRRSECRQSGNNRRRTGLNRIGVIGFGTMGEAIIRGLRAQDATVEAAIIERSAERRLVADGMQGVTDMSDHTDRFASFAELVVLAVKPQDLESVARKIGSVLSGKNVISILAGTSVERLTTRLPNARFVRFMPNLAASIGQAAVGVAIPADTNAAFRNDALQVARAIGTPFEIPERLLAAFTGISGSGIAFVFSFIHALALGGTKAGITYEESLAIALQVLRGAGSLAEQTALNPQVLLSKVISPAGTTIEGIRTLEHGGFTACVMDAVAAAARRADELEV